ncbi:glycoside hydrolase family 32 protein [Paenibacillus sp. Soil522]|uniref:glycoside hydrolase family 32 protein n=1 Tax=Paenibacillus sp. Soil522 TaxID=1736388 RepID=UPI001F31BBB6|nr:glycoside hydrolase family 32 protein [Paenibacillus sp. Soil522]
MPKALMVAAISLAAAAMFSSCSGEDTRNPGVTEAPGRAAAAEPAEAAAPAAEAKQAEDRLFWKPPEGWVGDVMPFNDNGQIHLFYLQDWRDGAPGFHPWHLASTANLTDYSYAGESIPFGEEHEQDLALGTGSVIKAGDTYHAYYTGHNWKFPQEGKPKEAVMHAVSKDLKTWTKAEEDTFYAPAGYEKDDFRDPYVLFNEEQGEYWMLVSARKEGTGGVIAVLASKDLSKWEVREPLSVEASSSFFMLECPDVFRMNGKWVLVFSEFSDKKATHYRVSDTLNGPWEKLDKDVFDGRAFYAGKTGSLGERRFLFGWVPTRQLEKDYMKWDWAGNMVAHEMTLGKDGRLGVKVPDEVDRLLSKKAELGAARQLGSVTGNGDETVLDGEAGVGGIIFGQMPQMAKITGTVRFDKKVSYSGLVAGVGEEPEKAYGIQIEPAKDRIRYDVANGETLPSIEPDVQVPIDFEPGVDYKFTIVIENDVAVFYIGDSALTTRIYKMPEQAWGWYSRGGKTTLSKLELFVPAP